MNQWEPGTEKANRSNLCLAQWNIPYWDSFRKRPCGLLYRVCNADKWILPAHGLRSKSGENAVTWLLICFRTNPGSLSIYYASCGRVSILFGVHRIWHFIGPRSSCTHATAWILPGTRTLVLHKGIDSSTRSSDTFDPSMVLWSEDKVSRCTQNSSSHVITFTKAEQPTPQDIINPSKVDLGNSSPQVGRWMTRLIHKSYMLSIGMECRHT